MRRARPLLVLALLAAAALSGVALARAHRATGVTLSAAHVPLGGFEPFGTGYFWLRAEEMRREGRLVEAVASYRIVAALQPQVAQAFTLPAQLLAWTRSESGDPAQEWEWVAQGIEFLETGLEFSPGHPDLVFQVGYTWYARVAPDAAVREIAIERTGRLPEELAAEQFRRLEPSERNDEYLADTLLVLGLLRARVGDLDGAISAYREAEPIWARIAKGEEGAEAARIRDEIAERIRELEERIREK